MLKASFGSPCYRELVHVKTKKLHELGRVYLLSFGVKGLALHGDPSAIRTAGLVGINGKGCFFCRRRVEEVLSLDFVVSE